MTTIMRTMIRARRVVAAVSAVALSSCTVGPEFESPANTLPPQWRASPAQVSANDVDVEWWKTVQRCGTERARGPRTRKQRRREDRRAARGTKPHAAVGCIRGSLAGPQRQRVVRSATAERERRQHARDRPHRSATAAGSDHRGLERALRCVSSGLRRCLGARSVGPRTTFGRIC